MCYQDSRWHTICNHTVKSQVECPMRCAQYGCAIDTVETQLPAYCYACRAHVDSFGLARRLSRSSGSRRKLFNFPERKARAGSASADNLRLAAPGAASPTASADALRKTLRTYQKRVNPSASMGDLTRSIRNGSSQSSLGEGLCGLVQGQETPRQAESQPEMLSPTPQKPQLSLHIPEELPEEPQPACSSSEATVPEDSNPATVFPSPLSPPDESNPSTVFPSPSSPITSRAPCSISASLEKPPSRPPTTPLPSFPPMTSPTKQPLSISLVDLREQLWGRESAAQLRGSRSKPLRLSRNTSALDPLGPQTTIAPLVTAPAPATSRSLTKAPPKSSIPEPSPSKPGLRMAKTTRSTLPIMRRPRTSAAANHFPPAKNNSGRQKFIDIHDPPWLTKTGMKWDAHGLGTVSAAV